jgi:hypothetical protein
MMPRLTGRDQAITKETLDMTVITRAGQHRTRAQMVGTAVTHMRPVGGSALHQTYGTGRPRPGLKRQPLSQVRHLDMCAAQRQVKKTLRIEQRLRLLLKAALQGGNRGLRRQRTMLVATHAVSHHEQYRTIPVHNGDAILIVFAMSCRTELGGLCDQSMFPDYRHKQSCYS